MDNNYSFQLAESIPVLENGKDYGMIFKLAMQINDPDVPDKDTLAELMERIAAPGDYFTLPDGDGPTEYIVHSVTCEKMENADNRYFVRCECILPGTQLEQLGEAAETIDANGDVLRTVKYSVPAGTDFSPEIGETLEWGTADTFKCSKLETGLDPVTGRRIVSVTGRKSRYGMLAEWRSEEFAGFDESSRPLRNIYYHSLWRAPAAEAGNFENLSGTAASGWAAENAIVTGVEPARINQFEYEFTISAEDENNSSLNSNYTIDNRTNLGGRRDYRAMLSDFRLTPEMAGFRRENSRWVQIENWNPATGCPFNETSGLDESMINAIFKCVLIRESFYLAGGAANAIDTMVEWASSRVFSGSVGSCSGSFLRAGMDCDELNDTSGNRWTKVTCTYQRAPESRTWNAAYWNVR